MTDYGYQPLSWQQEPYQLISKERKPVKLTMMQKLLMAKDDQTLTKAGYINGDMELTELGEKSLLAILFAANKAELVKLAQADLDEEKNGTTKTIN